MARPLLLLALPLVTGAGLVALTACALALWAGTTPPLLVQVGAGLAVLGTLLVGGLLAVAVRR